MFEAGFFGTSAPLYMDIVTLFFALLPIFLGFSIYQAAKGNIQGHYRSQIAILAVTLVMVVIFEIGVRISGGFAEYVKMSSVPYDFLLIFLVVHIVIALLSVAGWMYLLASSYKLYQKEGRSGMGKHKKMGKWIFAALTLTSAMGCCVYLFLFVLTKSV